jgi:catechol 2,3-dioxygenase-like lactoylglutathione lyase family enzyme
MTAPAVSGLHHLKVPVSDLDATLDWYERVFGAVRRPEFDHVDREGNRFAAIVDIPGLETMLEFRVAPRMARDLRGFDPIIFSARTHADLLDWQAHLDGLGIDNSGIIYGIIGWTLIWHDPDGLSVRVYSEEEHAPDMEGADIGNPWLQYPN